MVANTHCIHLVFNVSLQNADRHFALFRLITMPIRVTSDKFVQYSVNYTYFGLLHSQQSYLLLLEASLTIRDGRCCKKDNSGSFLALI